MSRVATRPALFFALCTVCAAVAVLAGAETVPGTLISLTVGGTPDRVVVELTASRPITSQLETLGTPTSRVFVDLLGVTPRVPDSTDVNLGAVKRVRVGLNRSNPPVTRVVLDIEDAARYHVEPGATERELRITVETDSPSPTGFETDSYGAWFSRTAHALRRLLTRTSASSDAAGRPGGQEGHSSQSHQGLDPEVVLEWSALRHHLGAITPPPELAAAHELLVTAGAVGHAAIAESSHSFAMTDVRSATAGASILVRQAEELAAPYLPAEPVTP